MTLVMGGGKKNEKLAGDRIERLFNRPPRTKPRMAMEMDDKKRNVILQGCGDGNRAVGQSGSHSPQLRARHIPLPTKLQRLLVHFNQRLPAHSTRNP